MNSNRKTTSRSKSLRSPKSSLTVNGKPTKPPQIARSASLGRDKCPRRASQRTVVFRDDPRRRHRGEPAARPASHREPGTRQAGPVRVAASGSRYTPGGPAASMPQSAAPAAPAPGPSSRGPRSNDAPVRSTGGPSDCPPFRWTRSKHASVRSANARSTRCTGAWSRGDTDGRTGRWSSAAAVQHAVGADGRDGRPAAFAANAPNVPPGVNPGHRQPLLPHRGRLAWPGGRSKQRRHKYRQLRRPHRPSRRRRTHRSPWGTPLRLRRRHPPHPLCLRRRPIPLSRFQR